MTLTLLQVAFWCVTHDIRPTLEITPDAVSDNEADVVAMGDRKFYFRWHLFNLQNAGLTYGRATELREYDYEKLYYWFRLLDRFDNESNFLPSLASYYFGRTGDEAKQRFIARYLAEYTKYRLESKWFWQVEAVHVADHKLNDRNLSLALALPLLDLHEAPVIVRELPAFVYERRGEMDKALAVMDEIRNDTVLPQGELNFIGEFIETRLKKRDGKTLFFDNRAK